MGPPPTVMAFKDVKAPSAPGCTASCSAMVVTSIVQLTRCCSISSRAFCGLHLSKQTMGAPSDAGRYMPKQNAATEDSGTNAATGSPARSPTASTVQEPA